MILVIFMLAIGGAVGFYYARQWIDQLTVETNSVIETASKIVSDKSSPTRPSDATTKDLADKTLAMIYPANDFQAQATTDLQKYASETGIVINSISTIADSTTHILPGNIKVKKLAVSVSSPVSFASLMQFVKAIETNTPKMQITSLNLSNVHANKGDVTVEPLNIEVYVR